MNELTLDSICNIRLYQSRKGYRFSIDPVLLSGFAGISGKMKTVADLGAGTGVIGLILAGRYAHISVTLIEMQESLANLAERNISLNHLQGRVKTVCADISRLRDGGYPDLRPGSFDCIVTNPPFRSVGSGRISTIDEKAIARHEIALTQEDLIAGSAFLLKNSGRFFIVYHPVRLTELITCMRNLKIEPKRMRFVHPETGKEATMVLIEGIRSGGVEPKVEPPLYIYSPDGEYTDEVARMLGSFQIQL